MGLFVALVTCWKPLTIVTKKSILDIGGVVASGFSMFLRITPNIKQINKLLFLMKSTETLGLVLHFSISS